MSRLLVIAALVAMTSGAHAGGNPDIRIYIDFDPPNYVQEIEADIYTMIEAYVCMDNIGEGLTSVSFAMNDPSEDFPGVVVAPGFVPYLMPPP